MSQDQGSLVHRYVDPATSLGEILFGLIMTLTFTLGAGIIIEDEGREGARQLLIAVIGCNIAWGVIDGALYLVNQLFDVDLYRRVANVIGFRRGFRFGFFVFRLFIVFVVDFFVFFVLFRLLDLHSSLRTASRWIPQVAVGAL